MNGINEGRQASTQLQLVVGSGLPRVEYGFGIPIPATNPSAVFAVHGSQLPFRGSAGAPNSFC